jgi:hypothetical protein
MDTCCIFRPPSIQILATCRLEVAAAVPKRFTAALHTQRALGEKEVAWLRKCDPLFLCHRAASFWYHSIDLLNFKPAARPPKVFPKFVDCRKDRLFRELWIDFFHVRAVLRQNQTNAPLALAVVDDCAVALGVLLVAESAVVHKRVRDVLFAVRLSGHEEHTIVQDLQQVVRDATLQSMHLRDIFETKNAIDALRRFNLPQRRALELTRFHRTIQDVLAQIDPQAPRTIQNRVLHARATVSRHFDTRNVQSAPWLPYIRIL